MGWDFGPKTQTGTNGNDKLVGKTGSNTWWNVLDWGFNTTYFSYKDQIKGLNGNDTLVGEKESDTLEGGNGNDWLYGGSETTDPNSDSGYTFVQNNVKSHDRGAGNDSLLGGNGNDALFGGAGNDTLNGGANNDVLQGGNGTDSLVGGAGNDVIFTGKLSSGNSDIIYGGADKDIFFLGDTRTTVIPGSLDAEGFGNAITTDITDLGFTLIPGAGTLIKAVKEVVPMIVKGVNSVVDGYVDEPPAGEYAKVKDFNPLEDIVIIPLNYDSSKGEDPNVFISDATNTQNFLSFSYDQAGSTDIFATLNFANAGDIFPGDTVLPSQYVKSVRESILDNAVIVDKNGVSQGLNSNGTTEKIINSNEFSAEIQAEISNMENPFLILGATGPLSIEGENKADYLYGSNFNDVIYDYTSEETVAKSPSTLNFTPESNHNDQVFGYGGNDRLLAGGGNDTLKGGEGSDAADYSDSTGSIEVNLKTNIAKDGYGTTDTLDSIENVIGSNVGNDKIIGNQEANILEGLAGDDSLEGHGGNDYLDGGNGSDYLSGHAGNDYLVGGINWDPVDKHDTLDGGTGDDTLKGGDLNDSLIGGDGNDYLYGESDLDTLEGGNGNDYLDGSYGRDQLFGGNGNDTLIGHTHQDILSGGYGIDTLIGGAGADTFVFDYNDRPSGWTAKDNTTDFITDFSTGEDVIHIDKSAFSSGNVRPYFDYDSSSQSGILSVSYVTGNAALRSNIVTIENLASASEFNMSNDVQLI